VKYLPLPMNSLVYPEISPDAHHTVATKDVANVDDMEYETILSYGKRFTAEDDDVSTDTLLARTELAKYRQNSQNHAPDYRTFVNELCEFVLQIEKEEM